MITMLALIPFVDLGITVHRHLPALPCDRYYTYDNNRVKNPYGVVTVGLQSQAFDFSKATVKAQFFMRHESSMATSQDAGADSAGVILHFEF